MKKICKTWLLCYFLLAANSLLAVDFVNGQPQQISGSLQFTLWEDGDPHGWRIKGLRNFDRGENSLLVNAEDEPALIANPLIEAPPGFVVTTDELSLRQENRVEENRYANTKVSWTGYSVVGTWTVVVPHDTPLGSYSIQIRFPNIDKKLEALRQEWQSKMKAQNADYRPEPVAPLTIVFQIRTYRTQKEMVLSVRVLPKLQKAIGNLCLVLIFCNFTGVFILGLFVQPRMAIVPFCFAGALGWLGAVGYFDNFHAMLTALEEVDRATAATTAVAFSCTIFLIGFLFMIRVEKSPLRSSIAICHASYWLLLTAVTLIAQFLPATLPTISEARAGFPYALPVALIGVALPFLLHFKHFRTFVGKLPEFAKKAR